MFTTNRPPRPRLTGPIFLYGLADIFGLTCVAIGGSWFLQKQPVLLANFPTSTAEAVACAVGGLAVMIWAVGHIYQEMSRQAPEIQAALETRTTRQAAESASRQADKT